MKSSFSVLLVAAALGAIGCSSAPRTSAPPPAATPTPSPKVSDARNKRTAELFGLRQPGDVEGEDTREGEPKPFVDPETGRKVLRIMKGGQYFEKDGQLHLAMIGGPGVQILRQDATSWIVEAPRERKKPEPKSGSGEKPEELSPIVEVPKSEAEVVTPKTSKETFRFEEMSAGLPRSGMWRENFDVADVLGIGHPQIVAPPARLTGQTLKVFKLDKDDKGAWRWRETLLEIENPEKVDAAYGVAAVGDLDGDGKLDIVFGGHGVGPAVAFNKGGGKFRVETRGLPRELSTRAIAIGDLNGDGKKDLLAVSDDAEWLRVGGTPTREPSGYMRGYDVRAYLNEGGTFREVTKGLDGACFGYAVAVAVPKTPAGGLPFYSSACRYFGASSNLYEFDPKAEEFRYAGVGVVEAYGQQTGAIAGTYRGGAAIYASWLKHTPSGGQPKIDGQGVTVYYRGADGKVASRRVVKTLQFDAASPAIGAGDLNGDGLDDVVWADESAGRLRVFFQTAAGDFEELASEREPTFVNHPTALRLADVDGDGRLDVVLMYQYLTGDETRAGGFRVFRGLAK